MLNFYEFVELVEQQLLHIDVIQCAVLVLGVSEVLLARANHIWLYPTGIAATLLAIFSLYSVQLYAECMLHLYYIIMSVYGWWYWSSKKNQPPVQVTFATNKEWIITIAISFGGSIFLFVLLSTLTDSEVPVWDAWVSGTAWAGMWLLARRKVENWLLLNLSNAFAIPLLFYKGLPLLGLLTIILFIVACKGYVDWQKLAKKRIVEGYAGI
jgi:nicotinamide mononucleotide transporter